MSDRLAEFLYTTFCSASDKVAGGDVANWASLPVREREIWQAVAGRGRAHVLDQVFAAVESIVATAAKAVAAGKPEEWSVASFVYELRQRFRR